MDIATFDDVVKRYGPVTALDHLDLGIRRGEILGLLGPNGAGKTTAIRALVGLASIDSGRVDLFGEEQRPGRLDAKRRLGLVTQEVTVFEDVSARENLAFFGGLYGLRGTDLRERIAWTLDFVGLAGHADAKPKKYSGGMKRRLNIGCALVHRPELLVMDEPTVGIDPQSRNHILESVRALRDSGTTIVYTSHYMEEVAAIASRVLVMDHGRAIAEGTVSGLVERLRFEDRVRLEAVAPDAALLGRLKAVPGVKDARREGDCFLVVSEAGAGNLDALIDAARGAGGVRSVRTEEPTLEDVFLTLTGRSLRDGGES